jgi:hypothetical protein
MKKEKYLVVLFILVLKMNAVAQNVLWLTNGKKLNIKEYRISSPELIQYKTMKGKSKAIQSFDVFSITDSIGKEQVTYLPDTAFKDAFTIPEMRSYVQGQYDAEMKFKSPWTTVGGIAVAGASSVVINPVYVILVSTAYCSTIGITKPLKNKLAIPSEFAQNEPYILGYKKTIKHKRIKNAILGSGIGFVVGLGAFALVNK